MAWAHLNRQRTVSDELNDLETLQAAHQVLSEGYQSLGDRATGSLEIMGAMSFVKSAINDVKGRLRRFLCPIDPGESSPLVTHKGVVYQWSYIRNGPYPLETLDGSTTPIPTS